MINFNQAHNDYLDPDMHILGWSEEEEFECNSLIRSAHTVTGRKKSYADISECKFCKQKICKCNIPF